MAETAVRFTPENPRAYCRTCDQDFSGDDMFFRHRVGEHDYLYAEGLAMTPPRSDGRRCLTGEEMREKGWELNGEGRWCDPVKIARARAAFGTR